MGLLSFAVGIAFFLGDVRISARPFVCISAGFFLAA